MCGLNLTRSSFLNIDEMNSKIKHRGLKNKSHVLRVREWDFGHVRLPIQGLEDKYDQPFEYKNFVFLFVGEIYNYKELDPTAKSDIETLAKYWFNYGDLCLSLFDGMWSIVIYDKTNKLLHVVTDFLSKKPLYIHLPSFSISSEIKSLCSNFSMDLYKEDDLYFSRTGKWGYCGSKNTFFKNIESVPPGSHWIVDCNKNTVSKNFWYNPKPNQRVNIKKEVYQSVKNRLVSDVPISLLLSGGIDSSIIYKIMSGLTKDFSIFHIDNNEEEFLSYLNIPGNIRIQKLDLPEDMSSFVSDVLYFNESPFDLGSMLSQFCMAQAIAQSGFVVSISGDGADELFGGYKRSFDYDSQYSDIFDELVYYHLPRLDRLMMSQTIELRCPFLSRKVLEGALALPYTERIDKKFLRNMFSDILPKEIYERPKAPLKSKQVVNGGNTWRYHLINKFKEETIKQYFKGEKQI